MGYWDALGPLVGLAVGWGFTQASTVLATRQADKKVLKETVYFLLEVYDHLSKFERMEKAVPLYMATLREHLSHDPPPPSVEQMLHQMLQAQISDAVGKGLTELRGAYNACLLKLSSVDPINAHRLSGLENVITQVGNLMDSSMKGMPDVLATDPRSALLRELLKPTIESEAVKNTLSSIQEILLETAEKISRKTGKRVVVVLERKQLNENEAAEKVSKFFYNTLLPAVAQVEQGHA
jgi:hypothetical protein